MIIEEELNKLKEEINKKYLVSLTNFIYLRLSTLDNSIKDKDDQIKDAINKLRADFNKLLEIYPNLEKDGFKLFIEVKSAYKDSVREEFINLYENYLFNDIKGVKDILESKPKKNNKNLYIASFDRLSRVFFYSLNFQLIRKLHGINIYTINSSERFFEENYIDVVDKSNMEQTMFVFQLMMMSSQASQHSEDLSYKVKKRVSHKNGITISSKTNKRWGVAPTINQNMRNRIKERSKKFSYEEISEQHDIYQIKNNKRLPISKHTIKKIVKE